MLAAVSRKQSILGVKGAAGIYSGGVFLARLAQEGMRRARAVFKLQETKS